MASTMTHSEVLEWAEQVTTKFSNNYRGWEYTRDTGNLKYVRFKTDTTLYNSFWNRLKRGLRGSTLSTSIFGPKTIKEKFLGRVAWFWVSIKPERHLPDGVVNGGSIITFWEEDGEYITVFGPTVGMKVLEFLKSEPDNQHAKEILAEMTRVANTKIHYDEPLGR